MRSSGFVPRIILCSFPSKLVCMMPNDEIFCAVSTWPARIAIQVLFWLLFKNSGSLLMIISPVFLFSRILFLTPAKRYVWDDERGIFGVVWSVFRGFRSSWCVRGLKIPLWWFFHFGLPYSSLFNSPNLIRLIKPSPSILVWHSYRFYNEKGAITVQARIYTDMQTCCWFWCLVLLHWLIRNVEYRSSCFHAWCNKSRSHLKWRVVVETKSRNMHSPVKLAPVFSRRIIMLCLFNLNHSINSHPCTLIFYNGELRNLISLDWVCE